MRTPPRVDAEAAAQAIERVRARHAKVDAPHRDQISDSVHDMLSYLRKYGSTVPARVQAEDVVDAMILRVAAWWQGEEDELMIHRAVQRLRGQRISVDLGAVADILGVGSVRALSARHALLVDKLRPAQAAARDTAGKVSQLEQWARDNLEQLCGAAVTILATSAAAGVEGVAHQWLYQVCDQITAVQAGEVPVAPLIVYTNLALEQMHIPADGPLAAAARRWSQLTAGAPGQVSGSSSGR